MALFSQPPQGAMVDQQGMATPGWAPFFSTSFMVLSAITQSGTTAQRPTSFLFTGRMYFDTTLGKPIWYKTAGWVDATGAAV